MARTEIFTIGLNSEQYVQAARETTEEIIRITAAQKVMKGTTSETSAAFVQNSVDLKANKKNLRDLETQIENNNETSRDFVKVEEDVNKELKKEGLTINELRAQNKKLLKAKNNLIITNKEEAKLAKKIDKQLNLNNQTLTENSDAYTQQKRNIGNYSSALDGLSPRMSGFIRSLQGTVTGLKATRAGLSAGSKGLNIFKIALISTGIGAIVVAIGLLIVGFTKSQKAVDFFSAKLAGVKAVIGVITDAFVFLADLIVDAMENPGEAWDKFVDRLDKGYQFVKGQVIDRFVSNFIILKNTFLAAVLKMRIAWNNFTGDAEEAQLLTAELEALNEQTKENIKIIQDLNDEAINTFNNAVDAVGNFINAMAEAKTAGEILERQLQAITKEEVLLDIQRAATKKTIKELEVIASNKAETTADRLKAQEEGLRLETELLLKQEELGKRRLAQLLGETKGFTAEIAKTVKAFEEGTIDADAAIASLGIDRSNLEDLEDFRDAFIEIQNNQVQIITFQKTGVSKLFSIRKEGVIQAQKISKDLLNAALADLKLEIDTYKEVNKEKLDSNEELNSQIVADQMDVNSILNQLQAAELLFRFEQGLLSEEEFNLAKLQLTNDFGKKKSDLLKSLADKDEADRLERLAEEKAARQLEFELELEENSLRRQTEFEQKTEDNLLIFENEAAILNEQLAEKEITQEEHRRRLQNLNDQFDQKKLEATAKLHAMEKSQKLAQIQSEQKVARELGNIAKGVFGKNKALSSVMALADTWFGAQRAYTSQIIPGDPSSIFRAVVAAASAVATGLGNVAKINSVKFHRGALLRGPSHNNNGIPFTVGGRPGFEAEGGEAIINKRSMSDPFLRDLASQINQAGGGVAFEHGGGLGRSSITSLINQGTSSLEQINDLVDRKINKLQVINNASETAEVARDAQEVRNFANL